MKLNRIFGWNVIIQYDNNIKLEYEKIKIEKEELNKEITRLKENVKKYH